MQIEVEISHGRARWLRRIGLSVSVLCVCMAVLFIVGKWRGRNSNVNSRPQHQESYVTGIVTDVVDGDTIKFLDTRFGVVTLRLFGIDAPERNQPFGTEATAFTRAAVAGKEVAFTVRSRDRYGRFVVVVVHDGQRNLNEELLSAGFAWWYQQYAPNESRYRELEIQAKSGKAGLWHDENASAPWLWRTQHGEADYPAASLQ